MAKILREDAAKLLGPVPAVFTFKCNDGSDFRSVRDLGSALTSMAAEVYGHHVSEDKSDFSAWVKHVIGDEKLARDLSKSTTPYQAEKSVKSRVAFLETKLV